MLQLGRDLSSKIALICEYCFSLERILKLLFFLFFGQKEKETFDDTVLQ